MLKKGQEKGGFAVLANNCVFQILSVSLPELKFNKCPLRDSISSGYILFSNKK
jgi:hypothetical protein